MKEGVRVAKLRHDIGVKALARLVVGKTGREMHREMVRELPPGRIARADMGGKRGVLGGGR